MLSLNQQLTVGQRLQKCVSDITSVDIYVPLAGVLMLGTSSVVPEPLPFTACTNGRDVVYGEEFISAMSDAEYRFLILHENYHKLGKHLFLLDHLFRMDAKAAGIACDHWINLQLIAENEWIMANVPNARMRWPDGFAVMPKHGYADPKYKGWDIPKIFWDIRKQQQEEGEGAGDGEGEGTEGGFDTHDHEGAQELDSVEKEEIARELESAIRQGMMTAGKLGCQSNRALQELVTPKVPWEKVAQDWTRQVMAGKDFCTWAKPNRRHLGQGVYMPTSLSERLDELVLAPDMSGSCYHLLGQWLSEFKKILMTLRPTKLHIVWWDTEVAGHQTFLQDELDNVELIMQQINPKGAGGTDVRCVPTYLQAKGIRPTACAVLTDGDLYGGWGNWDCPVLWCIAGNPKARPTIGKSVHIEG